MVGMWKAFAEMSALGWIEAAKRPRMVSVQAANCAPIVRAFERGTEKAEPWANASTIADGLRVPRAIGDFLVLRAVRESGGTALSVDDVDMVRGMKELGRLEGISAADLERSRKQLHARLVFDDDSVTNIAHQLGYFETVARADLFLELRSRIASVTLEEVAAAARTMLADSNRTVGWFDPLPVGADPAGRSRIEGRD